MGNVLSCDRESVKIYQHSGFTTTINASFTSPSSAPEGLGFDGTNILSSDTLVDKIFKHAGFSTTITDSFAGFSGLPVDVAYDGINLLSCDYDTNKIYKHSGFSSIVTDSFITPSGDIHGLNYDGINILSSDSTWSINKIYKHSGFSTTITDSFTSPSTNPTGLGYDGTNISSADTDSDKIYKYSSFSSTITDSFASPSGYPTGLADDSWSGETTTSTSSTTTSSSTSSTTTSSSTSTSTTSSTSTSTSSTTTSSSTSTSSTTSTSTSSTTTSSSTSSTTTSSSTSTTTSSSTSTSSTTTSSSTSTSSSSSTSTSSTTTSSSTSTSSTTIGGEDFERKHFVYKVYDGTTYSRTWYDEVISDPKFRNVINGGPGELIIKLARNFDDFGEDVDVKLGNKVELWVYDRQVPNGQLLYTGFISGYRPILDGNTEYVEITVLSYIYELSYFMLRDSGGDTEIAYNSYDPSDIIKDIIDKYRDDGGTLNYSADSIETTNTTVSYTFNTNTAKEAIDKCIELAPNGWYWTIDASGIVYFKNKSTDADHDFIIGRNIGKMETWRRTEDIVNRIYFTGFTTSSGTGLYRTYQNSGSITAYGLHAIKKVDHRVTNPTTADTMANRILDAKIDPEIRTLITILDNNGVYVARGYDIETIQPGETMEILNLAKGEKGLSLWDAMQWDVDVWDHTLSYAAADVIQILATEYTPDLIRIEASSRLPEIPKRIEDINRNLEDTRTVNNPASPTAE